MLLIAVPELMAKAKSIAAQTYDPIGGYLAAVYLMDAILRWLERTSRIPGFEMEGRKAWITAGSKIAQASARVICFTLLKLNETN